MAEKTPPKEEATQQEEARKIQRERITNTVADVMKISAETECPPEAVALVMLLHGLNAQANFEGASLRTILMELFGRKKLVVPEPDIVH